MQSQKSKKIVSIMLLTIFFIMESFGILTNITFAKVENSDDPVIFEISKKEENKDMEIPQTDEEVMLTVDIEVLKEGQGIFKDGKVEFENPNFEIGKIENEYVKSVEGNKILLNEITYGNKVRIDIPLKFLKKENFKPDYFNRNVMANLSGKYSKQMFKKIEEIEINKSIDVPVKWDRESNIKATISTGRFFKQEKDTILEEIINTEVVDNKNPIKNEIISIYVPRIDGQLPKGMYVLVNGKKLNKNNIVFDKEEGTIVIANVNKTEEGKSIWNDGINKYQFIYKFENLKDYNSYKVGVKGAVRTELYGQEKIVQNNIEEQKIETKKNGEVVTTKAESKDQIYKGYLYGRDNSKETIFEDEISIDILDNTNVDKIVLSTQESFLDKDIKAYENVSYKEIKFSNKNLKNILGNDGIINVTKKQQDGTIIKTEKIELGKIIDTEEIKVIFNEEIKSTKVEIDFGKPINSGVITIRNIKSLTRNNISFEEIKNSNQLIQKYDITYSEKENLKINKEYSIKLAEPEDNIKMTVDNNLLTTGEKIERKITIEANTNTPKDKLLKNLLININLPKEVEQYKITGVSLLNMEYASKDNVKIDSNLNRIEIPGEQLEYQELNPRIEIYMEMTLDKKAITKEEKITANVENDSIANKQIECAVTVKNPKEILIENNIEELVNKETEETPVKNVIQTKNENLMYTVKMRVVGNSDEKLTAVKILGDFPTDRNNKNNMGITVSELKTQNKNVYYTENSQATADLNNNENGWQKNKPQNPQKYLIDVGELNKAMELEATYTINIPKGLNKDLSSSMQYSVMYQKNGTILKLDSKNIELETPKGLEIKIVPSRAGMQLREMDKVRVGEVIKYQIILKSDGNNLEGLRLESRIPEGTVEVVQSEDYEQNTDRYFDETTNEKYVKENISIKDKETKTFEYYVRVKKSGKIINNVDIVGSNIRGSNTIIANNGDIQVENRRSSSRKQESYQGDVSLYGVIIKNFANTEKRVKVNVFSTLKGSTIDIDVDEIENSSKEVILKANEVKYISYGVKIPEYIEKEERLRTYVELIDLDNKDKYYSNDFYEDIGYYNLTIEATSNNNLKPLNNGDDLIYKFKIKNTGSVSSGLVGFEDEISEELELSKILIDNKNITNEVSANEILYDISVSPNQTIEITIETKVKNAERDRSVQIFNKAVIRYGGEVISTANQLTHILAQNIEPEYDKTEPEINDEIIPDNGGDSDNGSDSNNGGDKDDNEKPEENKKYNISGIAWIDLNKNGIQESNEPKMKNVKVKIYDMDNNRFLRNKNKIIEVKTMDSGNYNIQGIPSGKYALIFEFDKEKYKITKYKANGTNDENSSKVAKNEMKLENQIQEVVTSGIIDLNNDMNNINIGLVEIEKADFKLEKYITKVVTKDKKGTITKGYNNKKLVKLEINPKKLKETSVTIEYKIKVTNVGEVGGYIKEIVDYLPKDLTFNSEKNKGWEMRDDNLYNSSFANEKIKVGESREVLLILDKKMTEDNTGTVTNKAEISKQENDYGVKDINSTPLNRVEGENDMDTAKCIISIQTGKIILNIVIILGILSTIAIIITRKINKERR